MNLKEIINESADEKDMEKLVSFLNRIQNGKISQQGMLAAGFNLRNPSANSETRLSETLGVALDINITEDDVKNALKQIRIKKASDLADKWNSIRKGKQEPEGQKRF